MLCAKLFGKDFDAELLRLLLEALAGACGEKDCGQPGCPVKMARSPSGWPGGLRSSLASQISEMESIAHVSLSQLALLAFQGFLAFVPLMVVN